MHRDLSVFPSPRRFSAGSSARLLYLAELIGRAYEPTATQLADLDRAYQSTADYLVMCPEFDGLLYRVHAHGSRQLGTMVRPLDIFRDGVDIDLAACLTRAGLQRYGGPGGPALLIEHLYVCLKRYADRHGLKIGRDARCVTITYVGGMTADFAPIIDDPSHVVLHGETHGRIPDRELERYLSTNPRGYCAVFDRIALIAPAFERSEELRATYESLRKSEVLPLPEADDVFGRLLARLVQLAKINRNITFGAAGVDDDLAPPSSFLTSLIAAAYEIEAPKRHDGPMDLLLDVIRVMVTLIQRFQMPDGSEHWFLPNPTAQNGNLAECMNDRAKQMAFDAWHEQLLQDLTAIVDAIDVGSGIDVLARAVERAFGDRGRIAVLEDNGSRREANRSLGRAVFVAGGVTAVSTATRAHTHFGD